MSATLVDLKQKNSRTQIQAFLTVAEIMGTTIARVFAFQFLEMFPYELEFGAYLDQEEVNSLLHQKCVSCSDDIDPEMLEDCLFLEEDGTPAFYQCFKCEDFSDEEYESMYMDEEGYIEGFKDYSVETGLFEVEDDVAMVEIHLSCSLCKEVYVEIYDTSYEKSFKLPDDNICKDCKNRN